MQTIKSILRISGGNSAITDLYGKGAAAPQIKIGIDYTLELDLRSSETDELTGQLRPYPYSELSSASAFYICMDADYDQDTIPKLLSFSNISITQTADGRTLLTAVLPKTTRTGLLDAVARNASINLGVEIAGYMADGDAANAIFCFEFNIQIRNRRYLGLNIPPEDVIENPDYLTKAEVLALLEEATRSTTPGPAGKSAYELAVQGGFKGTEEEWLDSLEGEGVEGKSAYDVALANGFDGSVDSWLQSLVGKSAYELAVQEGYVGELSEWLQSLKGKDGTGLDYDRSGVFEDRMLYDDEEEGFKFATATIDTLAKKTTLSIYTKLSAVTGDWSDPLEISFFHAVETNSYVVIEPIAFAPPTEGNEYLRLDLSSYPHSTLAQVTVTTEEGDLFLPLGSTAGIRKAIRKENMLYLYFGSQVPEFSAGKIYMTQLIGGMDLNTPSISGGTIAYGYITSDSITSVTQITAEMLQQETMKKVDAGTIDKTSLGTVPEGAWVVILVPEGYTATKFDGISGKTTFAEDNGAAGTGANGADFEIEGIKYKLYGEFKLNSAELFFYVDKN